MRTSRAYTSRLNCNLPAGFHILGFRILCPWMHNNTMDCRLKFWRSSRAEILRWGKLIRIGLSGTCPEWHWGWKEFLVLDMIGGSSRYDQEMWIGIRTPRCIPCPQYDHWSGNSCDDLSGGQCECREIRREVPWYLDFWICGQFDQMVIICPYPQYWQIVVNSK